MRQLVRAALPAGTGTVLDTFAGCATTLAACEALGVEGIRRRNRPHLLGDGHWLNPKAGSTYCQWSRFCRIMPDSPRYTELVPAAPEGLVTADLLPNPLPFGLEPRDFLRTVEDVHDLIHRLNTVLHGAHYSPLESLLDPAGFSGLISRTVASRLAAASRRLVVNAYHNGYPDLIVQGKYPLDRIQHGEGLEIKASRSDSNWQSHGPRGGWFVWVQFALDERPEVALFNREPTQIQVVMVAELAVDDWSWQPAAEGRIRSRYCKRLGER